MGGAIRLSSRGQSCSWKYCCCCYNTRQFEPVARDKCLLKVTQSHCLTHDRHTITQINGRVIHAHIRSSNIYIYIYKLLTDCLKVLSLSLSLSLCIYVCMSICDMYICVYVNMLADISICVYVNMYVNMLCMYICVYVNMLAVQSWNNI